MIRIAIVLALVSLAMPANAQLDNSMGIFFSDTEFVQGTTNFDVTGAPFVAYIVLVEGTMYSVAAYEMSLEITDPDVFVLEVAGPNGWTNFGSNLNHLCGFVTPVNLGADRAAVLGTIRMLYVGSDTVEFYMAASAPSSVGGAGPAVVAGEDLDTEVICNYTSGPDQGGIVATLNGEGIHVVPNQARSLSAVKALFD
jgi:hypothetical protein